jgi:hypothetical protein
MKKTISVKQEENTVLEHINNDRFKRTAMASHMDIKTMIVEYNRDSKTDVIGRWRMMYIYVFKLKLL